MSLKLCSADAFDPAIAANDAPDAPRIAEASVARKQWNEAQSRFDIYRADSVKLTSTLFGGGDWHWRLTGASGSIIADCGGYRNEAECLAAVGALRVEAGLASIFTESDPERLHETLKGLP